MRTSSLKKLASVAAGYLLLTAVLSISGGAVPRQPGVSPDADLAPSESLHVYENGAVIDGRDVHGTIYVHADDVTIRNTRVTAPAWFGIRVMDDATGLRIEDTTVDCTGERGWGVVFDHFTAERVAVNGCETAFAHLDRDHVNVIDSMVDGEPFEHRGVVDTSVAGTPKTDVGVPSDTELASSDSIHVRDDGAVIDGRDVHGTIYVHADDVTIRNTRVTAPAWFGIRVMDDATGLRIEDTTVDCTAERGWGVVFDHFTAERVAVNGCDKAFAHLGREDVKVLDSAVDGFAFASNPSAGNPTVSQPEAGQQSKPETSSPPTTSEPGDSGEPSVPTPPSAPSTTVPSTTTPPSGGGSSVPDGVGEFVRRVDVGPQASTFGHEPAGALKTWTGASTITDSTKTRDGDGVMRFRGYRFTGPIEIATKNVAFVDSEFVSGALNGKINGMIWSSSKMPSGTLLLDHVRIDQGMSGYSNAGVNVYQPIRTTIRYSLIEGSGDGIKANTDGLYEDNFISVNGQGQVVSPGHIDGIQGEHYKVNWTARHNTIIGGVGRTRPEAGGNIGIYAPAVSSPSYGVVAEDNYVDGFGTGISLAGTDPANPHIVRNNSFGTDFRWYPSLRIRTWDQYPYTVVTNNHFDRILNESTGKTSGA